MRRNTFYVKEEWRTVSGFPRYRISSMGRVQGPHGFLTPYLLHAYKAFTASSGKKKKHIKIHIAVLTAFRCKRPIGMVASHVNGNPLDNRISNLTWETQQLNIDRKKNHGTVLLGEKCNSTKLSKNQIPYIRSLSTYGYTQRTIARKFGVAQSTVRDILCGNTWSHV